MPTFKKPGLPLKDKTAGGFNKPAQVERKPLSPLEKRDINEELSINDVHINEELIGQPLLMRKYTKELAQLNKRVKSIKNKLEMQEAKLYVLYSNDGRGHKVAEVEALVLQDEEVQKLRVELYDAEELAEEFTGIVRSFAQRMEALQQLSNNQRKEMT